MLPIYAHRGASGYKMENTLAAFKEAIARQCTGIEIDLQLTADGEHMVIHDLDLFRLTGQNKQIRDVAAEEVMKWKVGRRFFRRWFGQRILTLREFIDFASEHQVALNVELKETYMGKHEKIWEVAELIKGFSDVHFSSFDVSILELGNQKYPEYDWCLIGKKSTDWNEMKQYSWLRTIHLNKRYYKSEWVKALCADYSIRFYGLTGKEAFITNPMPCVIGWISDYPDIIMKKQKRQNP
ncbi:glycerophosphodiester phosphodiesterase family protein [Chryseomicrobium sp. FSL W7-1435]|uniref:glycerophosphodiester phosphodiesterase n=1 Tax=Chryseomicrobium sp. FSL W7-1435 TaxID=2921704 RepID=UPI003159AF86